MKWMFFLSLPLYALDQLSKRWILHHIELGGARPVIPRYFDIVHVTNTGAAFGSFKNNNAFFIALSCVALVSVAVLLLRRKTRADAWRDLSLALLFAGVLGNLTDRLNYGHVIDFLLFNLHVRFADPWPAFNVADSCICVAVISFIVSSLRDKRKQCDLGVTEAR
jgi:signal peptidase II